MNISEWLRLGNRRCECKDIKLVIEKIKVKIPKRKHRDDYKNLIFSVLEGIDYSEISRHTARCSKCNKLYLAHSSKRGIDKSVLESGIPKIKKEK